VQIADSAKEARRLVLEKIPEGAQVHTALSETMRELGIAAEVDDSGRNESIRSQLNALDRQTQGREMRKLAAAPDYIIGSAHAVTDAGEIIVGSGSGSQLGAYAYAGVTSSSSSAIRSSSPTSTRAFAGSVSTACPSNTLGGRA